MRRIGSICLAIVFYGFFPYLMLAQSDEPRPNDPQVEPSIVVSGDLCTESMNPLESGCRMLAASPLISPPTEKKEEGLIRNARRWDAQLADRGVEPHLFIKTEITGALLRNRTPDQVDGRSLLETSVTLDFQKILDWQATKGFASMHSFVGGNGSDDIVLDAQGYSNINAAQGTELFELWIQKSILEGKFRLKIGRIDANTEFAYVENASGFLNSSMGYSPSIAEMSSYPSPRTGATVVLAPRSFFYLAQGIFRNDPKGMMSISEGGVRWQLSASELHGRVALGYWRHAQQFCDDADLMHDGAAGIYLVAEQDLLKQSSLKGAVRGLAVFFQYGNADPWSNEIDRHAGAGFQWSGPWARRPEDLLGLGASLVHLGPEVDSDYVGAYHHERTFEVFYRVQIKHWLSLTSDLQFIDHPNGDPMCPRALAGTLRSTISF
ncbi:MAG TPA: carbohydrate porin [Candidatus Acidoferrum sp.]